MTEAECGRNRNNRETKPAGYVAAELVQGLVNDGLLTGTTAEIERRIADVIQGDRDRVAEYLRYLGL